MKELLKCLIITLSEGKKFKKLKSFLSFFFLLPLNSLAVITQLFHNVMICLSRIELYFL